MGSRDRDGIAAREVEGPPLRLQVDALHKRLRAQVDALGPRAVVGGVTRAFVEIAAVAVERGLWSLEFSFDEDDSRVALLEARFGNGPVAERAGAELRGYVVRLLLPKQLPKNTFDGSRASEHLAGVPGDGADRHNLVARFIRALDDLGAYRFIEPLETESVEIELL